jgi:preprotein translocase subunit SecF
MGLVTLCLSVIFLAIPIVVWFVTRRKEQEIAPISDNEPIPPAG